jgi:catechol 2,3-dioxygenase-like lactoylglutathione lyase family enzyme
VWFGAYNQIHSKKGELTMLKTIAAYSGLAVTDIAKAKEFYTGILGLSIDDEKMGLQLNLGGGGKLFIYEKPDHIPANFTVLNFIVENIDIGVEELKYQGVVFEHYDNLPDTQDEKGILRGLATNHGPDIAWFKDPSGNILAIFQDS